MLMPLSLPGISGLILSEDQVDIVGMASKEGEVITFTEPVSTKTHSR